MGTWVGTPWNSLEAMVDLWHISGQPNKAGEAATRFLGKGLAPIRTEGAFVEEHPCLEASIDHLMSSRCNDRPATFYPPFEEVRSLGIDVPGLFSVMKEACAHKPRAPFTFRPGMPRDMVITAWCGLRMGRENVVRMVQMFDKALVEGRRPILELHDLAASARSLLDALSQIVNITAGNAGQKGRGHWKTLKSPLGLPHFEMAPISWCRLRGESVVLGCSGVFVATSAGCLKSWIRNMEMIAGIDAFPYLFHWQMNDSLVTEVLNTAREVIDLGSIALETMELIALARRRHIVWYAAFAALDPNTSLDHGLNRAPHGFDYKTGKFAMSLASSEVEWARELRERIGVQASETVLKLRYHTLPALPHDLTAMHAAESRAVPTQPTNSFAEEKKEAAWTKIAILADALGDALLVAYKRKDIGNRESRRELAFRAWAQSPPRSRDDCYGFSFSGDNMDFYVNDFTASTAASEGYRGQVIMRAILENYKYERFLEIDQEGDNPNAARLGEAIGVDNAARFSRKGSTVMSDSFMGTPPLHTSRTIWTNLRRAWATLPDDLIMPILLAPCPMTPLLGLAPYWMVPNTSRMVCQTESLEVSLRQSDKNTTLFTVKHGPFIPEPAGGGVLWDDVLKVAETVAADATDRISEELEKDPGLIDRQFVEDQEKMTATPTFVSVKSEQKELPGRPVYSTAYFTRSVCRAYTAACALLATVVSWTSGSYDSIFKEGQLNGAMRMEELSFCINIDLSKWSPNFLMAYHLMRITVVLSTLGCIVKALTLQAWLRNRIQYYRGLGSFFYKVGTAHEGFPMGWTPAADSLIHGTWLMAVIADALITAEDAVAKDQYAAVGRDCAAALLRSAIIVMDQIDDASVLMSWASTAGNSFHNGSTYMGKPEPKPPYDWDAAHMAPLFSEPWPAEWSPKRIKSATLAAGSYIDRKIAAAYPPHGATVNNEKKTTGARKMLYLNDLVERGVLVKKSGATAMAAVGKTSGLASNEFDRVRMSWSANRSAVECGFPDFAVASISLFAAHLSAHHVASEFINHDVFTTRESVSLQAPRVKTLVGGSSPFMDPVDDLAATLLMHRPADFGGSGIPVPPSLVYGGNNSIEDFLTFLAEVIEVSQSLSPMLTTIARASSKAMRVMLSLIEQNPTPRSILLHQCNMHRRADYRTNGKGLKLQLTRELLEELPPHPAWGVLLSGRMSDEITATLADSLDDAVSRSKSLVPVRPLWMLISTARELDGGLSFRASESERIINDSGMWKQSAELYQRVKESNLLIGRELVDLLKIDEDLCPATFGTQDLLTLLLQREASTGLSDTFTGGLLLVTDPVQSRTGRGAIQVVGHRKDLKQAIMGLPPFIDNLVTGAGRLSMKKPEKPRFDVSAAAWSQQVNTILQVVALWKEHRLVDAIARYLLDTVRPGASDMLMIKARTASIKMRQLSAFDDFRMTVVPEASPISSAILAQFPDERALRAGQASYDVGVLMAAAVSAGRLGLLLGCISSAFESVAFTLQIRPEFYREVSGVMPEISSDALENIVRSFTNQERTLGHDELDAEARRAGAAAMAHHKRMLTIAGWEEGVAETLASELGDLTPSAKIDPDAQPAGGANSIHDLPHSKSRLMSAANPWHILLERFSSHIFDHRAKTTKLTPAGSVPIHEVVTAPELLDPGDTRTVERPEGMMMDEQMAYIKQNRATARANRKLNELCDALVKMMKTVHLSSFVDLSEKGSMLSDGQILWSAVLLTASSSFRVAVYARSLGIAPTFRPGFIDDEFKKQKEAFCPPPQGWQDFADRYDSIVSLNSLPGDVDCSSEVGEPHQLPMCEPTVDEIAIFLEVSGKTRGSIHARAANVAQYETASSPEICYQYAYLLRAALAVKGDVIDVPDSLPNITHDAIVAASEDTERVSRTSLVGDSASIGAKKIYIELPPGLEEEAEGLPALPNRAQMIRAGEVVRYFRVHEAELAEGMDELE